MAQKGADALVELRADDVFEFAGLSVSLVVVDGESIFEQALGEAMAANHVAGAAAASFSQVHIGLANFYQLQIGHAPESAHWIGGSRSADVPTCALVPSSPHIQMCSSR